ATVTRLSDRTDASGRASYHVRVVVDNIGFLPTYVSKKALEKKVCRDLVAEIELPAGATLKTGKVRTEVGQLEGGAYEHISPYGWASDPTDHRAKIEWVVEASPGANLKVTLKHERAGTLRTELRLE